MTSSLVGSEMCIRDRGSCMHVASVESGGRGGLCNRVMSCRYPHCTPSVSYTHLTLPTICSV
eukprot:1686546-Prorocentrum_lima.AAC.1